jgi:hypothetical protein
MVLSVHWSGVEDSRLQPQSIDYVNAHATSRRPAVSEARALASGEQKCRKFNEIHDRA